MDQKYSIDDSRMPMVLGSALRVPSYSYPLWGIPDSAETREQSDREYEIEWKGGSLQQMQYVTDSIRMAGYSDFPQMVRNSAVREVREAIRSERGPIFITDIGAGLSSVALYDALEPDERERLHFTLVEPAEKKLRSTVEMLREMGMKEGDNMVPVVGRDLDASTHMKKGRQHVVFSVATLHHHAYIDTPFKEIYGLLRPGGYFITADWHNSMWEHPNRVYRYLQEFSWETKGHDLDAFRRTFRYALEKAPELDGLDEQTNHMIREFWRGWVRVRKEAIERGQFNPEDDIWMLEGHRPVERYVEEMQKAGFRLYKDPIQLLPDCRLLMTVVARKQKCA